jgi:hypothetical protein
VATSDLYPRTWSGTYSGHAPSLVRVRAVTKDDDAAQYAQEEQRVLAALRERGLHVSRLPELLTTRMSRECGGVLIEQLPALETHAAREFVIRGLSDRVFAGTVTNGLITLFLEPRFEVHRWTIGQALAVVATPADAEPILEIAADGTLGTGRQMIVASLGRLKSHDADLLLLRLLDDPDVDGHAVRGLASLPVSRLRDLDVAAVEPFRTDSRAWVRRSAAAVLKKASPSLQ